MYSKPDGLSTNQGLVWPQGLRESEHLVSDPSYRNLPSSSNRYIAPNQATSPPSATSNPNAHTSGLAGGWQHILKPPSEKDIRGPRRAHKGLDAPRPSFRYLVVLDFEWTADKDPSFGPSEIIEFPSVLVEARFPFRIVDEFQVYVKPRINPVLTPFIKELTAITQEQVDTGVDLTSALDQYSAWLASHGLDMAPQATVATRAKGLPDVRANTFAVVTWGDSDLMSTLHGELKRRHLPIPPHFASWINLKALFRQHYRREPRGGLQHVVETCGLQFDGRAHSGLVDSRNTAKIVVQMLSQGFQFKRTTRGFDTLGEPLGMQKRKRSEGGHV